MENEDEIINSQNDGGNQEADENLENTEVETEDSAEETDVIALKEKNRQLFARAKKAEGFVLKDGKWIKEPPAEKKLEAKDTSSEYLTKDEAVLIARGMELEDLEKLKIIQKGMGGTLKEAYDSDLYQSYAKAKEAEEKRRKAQLGASGGSGKEDEGFNKPNMTAEEHRVLWEKNRKK